jgi:hypothetical protein
MPPAVMTPADSPSDLVSSLPAPILRLLVLFAGPIALLRRSLEVLCWKAGRRVESWIVVGVWWGLCLGSSSAFRFVLYTVNHRKQAEQAVAIFSQLWYSYHFCPCLNYVWALRLRPNLQQYRLPRHQTPYFSRFLTYMQSTPYSHHHPYQQLRPCILASPNLVLSD